MRRLKSYSRTSLRFASVGGQRVLNSYQQLRSLILKRLQRQDLADMFAIPEEDAEKHEFVWYTSLAGPIVAFSDLPAEERQAREAELQERLALVFGLAQQIRSEAPAARRSLEAEIIEAAGSLPDDSCKFMVGDQIVLAAWGANLVNTDRPPVDLLWHGRAPAPPAAGELDPAPPPAPGAAQATVVPPGVVLAGRSAPGARREWNWRGLLWLLPLLLLILLCVLLLRGGLFDSGGFNLANLWPFGTITGPGQDNVQRDGLRREIAELKKQLAEKLGSCPVPPGRQPAPPQQGVAPPPQGVVPPQQGTAPPGQELVIPPEAQARKDLSFLGGCWNAPEVAVTFNAGTPSEISEKAEAVLCFGADGKSGQRTIRNQRISCEGPLTAEFQGNDVRIAAPRMKCSNNAGFSEATIVCRPAGNQTICETSQPGVPRPVEITFTKRAAR